MGSIRVAAAGPHATIQDMGRPGRQWLGIPEGGALDRDALALGNALVGNGPEAAAIEVCMGNFSAELRNPVRVALTGTEAGVLTVQDATGHSMDIPPNRSVDLDAGRVVRLGVIPDSNTATLAFAGGIEAPLLYGSRSTSPNAGIGGTDGAPLADGAELGLGRPGHGDAPELMLPAAMAAMADTGADRNTVRCVRGPQDDRFTDAALEAFFGGAYSVSPVLDRMGIRLEGPLLEHRNGADIPSDGIVTGTVQVPGNGLPIVLLADHQSTGGYTKIATVVTADIPKLARLRPGEELRFTAVTVEEAESLARERHRQRQRRLDSLLPAAPVVDLAALYTLGDTT